MSLSFFFFPRHNEANFKPVTLPGQEAAADYQVKLFTDNDTKLYLIGKAWLKVVLTLG